MVAALLIGGNGQLGHASAQGAREASIKLAVTTRETLDVTDADAVARLIADQAPRLVINASAYTAVDSAESEPERAYAVNRDGPAHLAQACARHNVPLIHVSTDYVFDGTKSTPYVESDPVGPLGVYGASKLAGEEAIRSALPDAHVILRTAWVYGPHGNNFVKTMLRLSQTRDSLNIVADQHGCPTSAPDLAQAILALGTKILAGEIGQKGWGTFHCAGAGETTWCEFARAIFAMAQRPVNVTPIGTADYPTPARRPLNSRLACDKLLATHGIGLRPWREGLADTLSALLEGPVLPKPA